MSECVIFNNQDLLPKEWSVLQNGPLWCFNPSLLSAGNAWWLAYRLVGEDQHRRIGLCKLDENLQLVKGSIQPVSDLLRISQGYDYPAQARNWFADPRLQRLGGRVFLYWNSGWHEPRNHQFLQELDPVSMMPIGNARELVLKGERRMIEKNWMLFEHANGIFAVYSASPHRILRVDMTGDGQIALEDAFITAWEAGCSADEHGELRGGAAPVLANGFFTSFCHSVTDSPAGYRYVPSAYQFEAKPPFTPVKRPLHPLGLGNPFGAHNILPRLNPPVGEVVYPCGAGLRKKRGARGEAREEDIGKPKSESGIVIAPAADWEWVISYGINDERCAVAVLPHAEVLGAMEAIP
jgi:hypothetical protein